MGSRPVTAPTHMGSDLFKSRALAGHMGHTMTNMSMYVDVRRGSIHRDRAGLVERGVGIWPCIKQLTGPLVNTLEGGRCAGGQA